MNAFFMYFYLVKWYPKFYGLPLSKYFIFDVNTQVSGLAEHRGIVEVRPNHLMAATLSLFRQGGGVDNAHHIRMFQLNFNPFRRAWLSGYATVFCVRIYLLIMSGKPAPPPKKVKQKFCIAGLRSKNLNEWKLHSSNFISFKRKD